MRIKKHHRRAQGFTLIELMVAVSIMSLLASVVLVSATTARQKSRDAQRFSDIKRIELALNLFYADHGHYPGNTNEGISVTGEMIGDDNGPIEQALRPYLSSMPVDPLQDGSVYFYSYDPTHCTDAVAGSCDCAGGTGAVLAFNKAETAMPITRKDTCSGGDMNQNNADYNVVFYPYGP